MKKYISNLLSNNPLCAIRTYNDILNLANGVCTRQIKKIVFDGTENWQGSETSPTKNLVLDGYAKIDGISCVSSHYNSANNVASGDPIPFDSCCFYKGLTNTVYLKGNESESYPKTIASFKAYLAQQYSNGTPVTMWYVLDTAETSIITVPTGLTGTVNGYLTQTGTPTPTAPIYPTANPVTMWADYTPNIYNSGWTTASGQPKKYNGGWT